MAASSSLSILLEAWKERWTPLQWLVEIRKADDGQGHKGLAECLVQQSTFGSTPNTLILSYLQHGITAELIPCSEALMAIHQNISKHRCLSALLNIMLSFVPNMSCPENGKDCLALAVSMVKAVYWILIVSINLLKLSREASKGSEDITVQYHLSNTAKCHKVFAHLMGSATYKSLIIVGKMEDQASASELDCQLQALMKELLLLTQSEGAAPEIQAHFKDLMINYNRLHSLTPINGCSDRSPGPVPNLTVQALLQIQNLVFPTGTPEQLADLFDSVMRTQNIQRYQLYLEAIRASLVGLLEAEPASMQESLWTGFLIFKLPHVLSALENRFQSQTQMPSQPTMEHSTMQLVLQQLRGFTPLLDDADQKTSCSIYKEFIQQYANYVPQQVADRIMHFSENRQSFGEVSSSSPTTTYQPVKLLMDAETRVKDVLQALETHPRSMDDKFLTQLSSLFSLTHSRWKIVAVSSMGKMQSLISCLIRITEDTKHPNEDDEDMKSSGLRGDLFNAAFIILCHFGQVFGRKVIYEAARANGLEQAFVTRWISSHIPECDKSRTFSPDAEHTPDQATVTLLLEQFFTRGPFMTSEARWDKLCLDVPNAMHEMLKAAQFESQRASPDTVQKLCESIKYEVPAWAICVCAWCCGHTNALTIEEREFLTREGERTDDRASNPGLLRYLLTPVSPKGLPQTFTDRCSMMLEVMREMAVSIERKEDKQREAIVTSNSTVTHAFGQLFSQIVKSKNLTGQKLHDLKRFLILGGPRWFCNSIIKEMLKFTRQEEMSFAADIGSCLMLLDIEQLIPALLRHAIPSYLRHARANTLLQDPKGWGIARLAAHAVDICRVREQGCDNERKANCESESPKSKGHKPDEGMDVENSSQTSVVQQSLVWFCEEMVAVVGDYKVGPLASVLKAFLQQAANCTNHVTGPVLACLPTHLTQHLLELAPVVCSSPDVILGICSLQNTEGRQLCAEVLCRGLNTDNR